jgi:hypothetical protein
MQTKMHMPMIGWWKRADKISTTGIARSGQKTARRSMIKFQRLG